MAIRSGTGYLCFFVVCSALLYSQHQVSKIPPDFQNKLYQITSQQIANNGHWAAFKKMYEHSNDTLVVVDAKKRNKVLFEQWGVGKFYFASNSSILYQKNNDVVRYDIGAKKEKNYKEIKQWSFLENQKKFILFQKLSQQNDVLVLDENGIEEERFRNVTLLNIVDQSAVIVSNNNKEFFVLYYGNLGKKLLFNHDKKITGILTISEKGILFTEESSGSKQVLICYYDLENKQVKRLSDYWSEKISEAKALSIDESNRIVINAWVEKDSSKQLVDIWYGNANDLRTKFYDKKKMDIVWDLSANSVNELRNEKCTSYLNLRNNSSHIICFDEFVNEDFTGREKTYPVFKYALGKGTYTNIGEIGSFKTMDRRGEYLLSRVLGKWILIDVETSESKELPDFKSSKPIFSKDSDAILFEELGGIAIYNIKDNKVERINFGPNSQVEVVNSNKENIGGNVLFYRNWIDLQKSIIVNLMYPDYSTGIAMISKGKVTYIEKKTSHRISTIKWSTDFSKVCYVAEDFNLPPQLKSFGKKSNVIYDSNKSDKDSPNIRSQLYSYKTNEGKNLQGVLLYPLAFNANKKYPMIVNIYENQSKLRNKFLTDGFSGTTDAFNERYYLKRGYFVFLPDIIYSEKGTGYSAYESVELGMDALKNNMAIDFDNVALIGFSHGGYETNFIATQSNRFKTYLAGGGNSDLIRSYFSYNYNFYSPFYFQYENGQYRMPSSFFEDKQLYINNSPVYFAEQVTAPMLLWAGMKDQNIFWEQTMEFYLALKRNNKKVTALFYPNEAHGFQKTESKVDIFTKVSDWLDYYLKGLGVDWIDRMNKK
ncbi:alpha/beta hydrolase family protein [Chryseobacterium sp. GP-SGM7]|uniref:alpha/beta hydrolase family protein n=1 Tax=Chryseobacterium sp. GP-SGM7 TaxID=3411323 RepID=UPI003B93C9E2